MPAPRRPNSDTDFPNRLRVVQLLPALDIGGAEQLVAHLAANLGQRGVQAPVMGVLGGGTLEPILESLDVPFEIANRAAHLPLYPRGLIQSLRRSQPQVLHAHSGTLQSAAVASAVLGLPLVYTEHGYYPDEPPLARLVDRVSAKAARALVCVSQPLSEIMQQRLALAVAPQVVPNGVVVPLPATVEETRHARARLGVPADAMVLGTIGRLVPVKDHRTLLRAFAPVQAARPDARLVLIGDGPERRGLEALAGELGISGAVVFAGSQPSAAQLAIAFDVYVSSSTSEGMPMAILEAMAARVPVIATDVGDCRNMVAGGAGVVVPPSDPGALTAALAHVLGDAVRRAALGAAAVSRVQAEYSLDVCAARYLSIYRAARDAQNT